jgi:hypothetical protein
MKDAISNILKALSEGCRLSESGGKDQARLAGVDNASVQGDFDWILRCGIIAQKIDDCSFYRRRRCGS